MDGKDSLAPLEKHLLGFGTFFLHTTVFLHLLWILQESQITS